MFILAETKESTVLLLLNAIYFKGYWTIPFNKDLTKRGTFYLNSKTTVDVPLMTAYNYFKLSSMESLNARILSLPYQVKCNFNVFIVIAYLFDNIFIGREICYVYNITRCN